MVDLVPSTIFIAMYFYYIYQIGYIQKGFPKNIVTFIILLFIATTGIFFNNIFISWIFISVTMMLFDLFYDDEPFVLQWYKVLLYGIIISVLFLFNKINNYISISIIYEIVLLLSFILLSSQRKYINKLNGALVILAYFSILAVTFYTSDRFINILILILSSLMFIILEVIFQSYQSSFEKSTKAFQQNVLHHQYEEIKAIYLNMRGWRHDYHNHIQTIKAHLELNQLDEVRKYLIELEHDLDRVDSYVKSGNLMADAILNSKISIAKGKNINVICKAELPEDIIITDIDLCVLLGNLLDNAIEACMKIDEANRFIRIYISLLKSQLYISVQNSAKEELDFNERNYISTKRGEHGLGMKRVKILVDKYSGYLNLQNEPGIFASEVTIPLDNN